MVTLTNHLPKSPHVFTVLDAVPPQKVVQARGGRRVAILPHHLLAGHGLGQGMDGLLGVAGMMTLLVMTGIIPENSLRKTHQ